MTHDKWAGDKLGAVTMDRRSFLVRAGLAAASSAVAQNTPPRPEAVESSTPAQAPAIVLSQVGFLPKSRKTVIYRIAAGDPPPGSFTVKDIGGPLKPFSITRPLVKAPGDVPNCLVGDFSDLEREAQYQITAGTERCAPFFVRPDAWLRTLPKDVSYHHAQRCGVAVPNVHPACHLDDARRRDTGEHVDVTGGWHDAGDLRKWMDATMMAGFGLLHLGRHLGDNWDLAGSGIHVLLDEMRWGNRYFLKMQDKDGRVWADTAGGVSGDNSDNHWTDNQIGTPDDRYINTAKPAMVQAMFVALEAMVAQAFADSDRAYAQSCLAAAVRCWENSEHPKYTRDLSWRVLAAIELHRATHDAKYAEQAAKLGQSLAALQTTGYIASQKKVRGFWGPTTPYSDPVYSALPPIALLELATALPSHGEAPRWRDAVRLYLDEYVMPMSAHSAYGVMPLGVYLGSPTAETYRPLEGEMTYRYFMPTRRQFWWLGVTSHLESHAVLLTAAAKAFSKPDYRESAFRQMEWVMGNNPFGACLMTGEGWRNSYPYSRFAGPLIGGIVNGIAGNAEDVPILQMEYGTDWRTGEYWTPHNAFYLWAISQM
jgi:hypothetical protein